MGRVNNPIYITRNCTECNTEFTIPQSREKLDKKCVNCRPKRTLIVKKDISTKIVKFPKHSLVNIIRCNNGFCPKKDQCKRHHLHLNYRDENSQVKFHENKNCQSFIQK